MAEGGAPTDGKETEIDVGVSVAAESAAGAGAAEAGATAAADAPAADAPATETGETPVETGETPAAPAETPAAEDAAETSGEPGAAAEGTTEAGAEPTATEASKDEAKSAVDRLSKGVEGVIVDFQSGLEAIPDASLRTALEDWANRMNLHVQELKTIMEGGTPAEAAPVPPLLLEEDLAPAVTEEEMQSVRDIGRQLASHRTGRTTQEVEEWTDPEEAAKEVEELRRVRRQIRYIFGGMLQSLPEAGTLRVDDLISDAGTSEAQMKMPQMVEKPPALPGQKAKVPVPPSKPSSGRPRSGGTELSSVTDSSADTAEDARRKEKKERKSRKHRHHSADAHDRAGKKEDGGPPKPYNWAEEVVKASLDPHNQWEFPSAKAGSGYEAQLAGWEQPRTRGTEVASRAQKRAEEVQRWERQHDSQQQYIFGTPR